LIAEGVVYVRSLNRGLAVLAVGSLALVSGLFLLAGLMTPLVATLVALGGATMAFAWIPLPSEGLLNSNLAIINLIVLAIAIGLLGPGAFSLDARMFGRREITIPSNIRATRS
jgi:uncharacterized membrane protein YphA (DoxX/SURF4 family)